MATLDLSVVIAYMAGILAAGFWARRKATTQEQFLVAGRSVGPWLYTGTLAAIILGGASTVGGVKLGYQYGISGLWFVFMFGLGIIVLSVVLVERILGLDLYTVPELLKGATGRRPASRAGSSWRRMTSWWPSPRRSRWARSWKSSSVSPRPPRFSSAVP